MTKECESSAWAREEVSEQHSRAGLRARGQWGGQQRWPCENRTFFMHEGRVLAVRKRARRAVAEAGHIVLVAAEGVVHRLHLERAVAGVDDAPDDFVVLHGSPLRQ